MAGQRQAGSCRPEALDYPESKPCGGVHGHGHHGRIRPPDRLLGPAALGEIDTARLVAGFLEGGGWPGYPERLMAELVGGKQKDPHAPNVQAPPKV